MTRGEKFHFHSVPFTQQRWRTDRAVDFQQRQIRLEHALFTPVPPFSSCPSLQITLESQHPSRTW